MRIEKNIQNIKSSDWSAYIEDHPQGNIYQTPEMYRVYDKTKNYQPIALFALKDDIIVGVIVAVIQKDFGILGMFTARSIIIGGPIVKDTPVLDLLLKDYNKLIKRKAIYSQVRNLSYQDHSKHIYAKHKYVFSDHLDIIINIGIHPSELQKSFKKDLRANIRRAERLGVVIKEINTTEEFDAPYEILVESYNRIKKPLPSKQFFKALFNELNPHKLSRIYVAEVEGECAGVSIRLFYKNIIYAFYAVADRKYSSYKIPDYMNFSVMKWGAENKYDNFDFGGAGKPGIPYGVRDYKLKFGGSLENFGRFEKVHKPLLMMLGKVAFSIWKRLKKGER